MTHRWAAASSTAINLPTAIKSVSTQLRRALGDGGVDFAFFAVNRFPQADDVARDLRAAVGARALVGCRASAGVVTRDACIYEQASLSVLAGVCPGAKAVPFYSEAGELPPLPDDTWRRLVAPPPGTRPPSVLLLPTQGFQAAADDGIRRLKTAMPGARVFGGVVPAGGLFWDDCAAAEGAVGCVLYDDAESLVARADGLEVLLGPLRATRVVDGTSVVALERRPAAEAVRELRAAGFDERDLLARVRNPGGAAPAVTPFALGAAGDLQLPYAEVSADAELEFCRVSAEAQQESAAGALASLGPLDAGDRGVLVFSCGALANQADARALAAAAPGGAPAAGLVTLGEIDDGERMTHTSMFVGLGGEGCVGGVVPEGGLGEVPVYNSG